MFYVKHLKVNSVNLMVRDRVNILPHLLFVIVIFLFIPVVAGSQSFLLYIMKTDLQLSGFSEFSWPMFRHNLNRTGYTESPAPLNNQTIWTYQTGGPVYSSPAVVDGRVYVGSDDGYLYCLNATTTTSEGLLIWKYQTGGPVKSSPTVIDGQVFFGSDDGYLYCLNATTGDLIWKFRTGGSVRSSPAVVNEKVIFGSNDGYVYSIDRFYLLDGVPYLIWKYGPIETLYSSPSIAQNYVFIGASSGLYCLNMETTNIEGELVWRYVWSAYYAYTPALLDNKLFVSYLSRENWCHFAALNASTGSIIWTRALAIGEDISSVSLAYNKVFVGRSGAILAFNQTTGELLWAVSEWTGGWALLSSPTVAAGRVFVGRGSGLYCLNESTGEILWKYAADVRWSSPAVANGRIYIGAADGRIIAFGNASLLRISASPSQITLGGSTLISGRLTDAFHGTGIFGKVVNLEFSTDRGETWIPIGSTVTASDGGFTYVWTPPTAGRYITVRAIFNGDDSYNGATSPGFFIHVYKIGSALTISADPSTITYGQVTKIEGRLTDPSGAGIPEQTIYLEYSTDSTTYNPLASVVTTSNGSYSYQWAPPSAAPYTIRANFTGNVNYTESSSTCRLVVNKASTVISISINPSSVACGTITTVNGSLCDQYGKALSAQSITLQYSMDGGISWTTITSINTFPDGSYLYPWAPQEVGSYLIRAAYAGSSNYNPSSSSASLSVVKGSSSIMTILAATTITYGQGVTISCLVSPLVSDGTITFQWSINEVDWNVIGSGVPSNGTLSTTWTPPYIGTFYIRAIWSGNLNYNGSTSPSKTLTVTKVSTSITVSPSLTTVPYGQTLTIAGIISPTTEGTVTLEYSVDGSTWIIIASGATSMGRYSAVWIPPDVGIFYVRAKWDGNVNYNGAVSTTATLNIIKASTTLSVVCSATTTTYGLNVTISGTISPIIPEVPINLEYSIDNGNTWNHLATLTTNTTGRFSYVWDPPTAASYQIRANWNGNTRYQGATSLPAHVTINKAPSSITCTLSTTSTIIDSSISISGKISPTISKATITIYYKLKGMPTYNILATVQTDGQGNYQYTWTPQSAGTYEITTAWMGTNNYDGSQSGVQLLYVLSPGQVPYDELVNELSQAKMLQYVFLMTTIAFLISTIYLAIKKKPKA